jgi:serine/threonine protein kinase/Tol biopolymer transport system component
VLTDGSLLGAYEIIALIGAGGMGEVYRARDPRLGRDVAIKVLPSAHRADPSRLRRFEQEARAAAALNHPNIVTIHSVERAGDVAFVTMEYIEGTSLARLIVRGGLSPERFLPIAIALADAVSAAHGRGLVHRDLKPSNIMVTADGRVKILDFGLAKLLRPEPIDAGETASDPLTAPGSIVGTLPYMSPEQVQGKPVDHRTDIFSLGVIFYEMATGRRPFAGGTSALLLSSILKDAPPLASDITDVPRELGRIIRHSLAKDPGQRYQTAIDLRNELVEFQEDLNSGSLPAPVAPRRARARWSGRSLGLAAAIMIAAGAGAYLLWRGRFSPGHSAAAGNAVFEQLTSRAGIKQYPSLSPDAKWVVYEGHQEGNADVYLQSVGGQNAINLTKDSPDDDTQPAFSPDGESIAFRSERKGGGIFLMGRTGESVRRLTDGGFNPTWSPDGTEVLYATDVATVGGRRFVSELWSVVTTTGEKRLIFKGDAVQPSWSPHGLRIAYWSVFGEHQGQRDIWTISATGGAPVPVTSDAPVDWNPVWSPDGGFLFFTSNRGGPMNLWRVPIDEKTGVTLGPPEPLNAPSSSAGLMSLSADGRSIAYTSFANSQIIQSLAFNPTTGSTVGAPQTTIGGSKPFTAPTPSPDGRWIAFFSEAPQMDIFISRADGTGIRQLTNDRANDRFPTWSTDGDQILFMSNRTGKNQIWSIKPDASGLRPLTAAPSGASSNVILSPDGSKLTYYLHQEDDSKIFVFDPRVAWDKQRPAAVPAFVQPGKRFAESSWSPDNQQLVGIMHTPASDIGSLVVFSVGTGRFTQLYESDAAFGPLWLNDGRRILFQERSKLMLIDSRTRALRELMSVAPDTMQLSSVTQDNRTIYFVRHIDQADIWLMRRRP